MSKYWISTELEGKYVEVRGSNMSKIKSLIINKMKPETISYLIVWAMERTPPKKAYFEFEAQPINKVVKTDKLEITIKKRIEYSK